MLPFSYFCNAFRLLVSNKRVIEMVKLRDARYCNLKLFLIYLVVYGHLIEPEIEQSPLLMTQYRWIYLFHMPLFCFLSGLFMTDSSTCKRQMKKTFSLYAVIQTLIVFFSGGRIGLSTPCWILWYLLSCSIWAGTGWLWYRFCKEKEKVPILIGAIAIGCAAGFVSSIGREYSLSRTLVFFPYFWMGLICDRKFPWEMLRPAGFPALVTAMILMLGGGN